MITEAIVILAAHLLPQERQEAPVTLPAAENAKELKGEGSRLTLSVLPGGTVKVSGKTLLRPAPSAQEKEDWSKLRDLFEARRQMEMYQEDKGKDTFVRYPLYLHADRSAPFHYLQFVLTHAVDSGGVTTIEIGAAATGPRLTFVPLTLPRDKGLAPRREEELNEVRIVLCAGGKEKIREHVTNKARHDADLQKAEQADYASTAESHKSDGHLLFNDVCFASVGETEIGTLYRTWVCADETHRKEKSLGEEKRVEENRARFRGIAAKAKEASDKTPSSIDPKRRAPIVLDADGAVAWEHVVGVVDALHGAGIEEVLLVASPRSR